MPFGLPRPLRPGDTPRAADYNAALEAVAQMGESSSAFGSDAAVERGGGGFQVNDYSTPGHWAQITGVAAGLHSHVEVTPDGAVLTAGTGYYGDTTANGTPAREMNGRTAPTGAVVWLTLDPFRTGWVFVYGAAGGTVSFYARITGNSAKRYSFVQVGVDGSDAVVDVSGGVTGSTSAGYALDIGGGSTALHTPSPALVVLMTANPVVAGTWLFGPITVCP